jgi:alpha-D-ribose 1-methylphosphonate 5-phosphate C-P lyase
MEKSKCHFCNKEATFYDVVLKDDQYIVSDVCSDHFSVEFVS